MSRLSSQLAQELDGINAAMNAVFSTLDSKEAAIQNEVGLMRDLLAWVHAACCWLPWLGHLGQFKGGSIGS